MILAYLLLITGLTISGVAIYYSVEGMIAIFSAAAVPITIMMTSLEVAKLVVASWLKAHWARVPTILKPYAVVAVIVLMLLTSMGIFGFLSKAHNDQNLVSGDVQSKIAIYDEKIKTAKENIESDRKQLKQMDEAVDQVMARSADEKGADKSNAIRKSQQRDRANLSKDIEANQRLISKLNDEAAPIRAEVRKVEAEVGPLKYIAKFIYGDSIDENILEKAVTWMIILIIFVFDPLAVIMLLAAQMTFQWQKEDKEGEWLDDQADDLTEAFYVAEKSPADEILQQGVINSNPEDNVPLATDFEGVKDPKTGEWVQTGPSFAYEADDGPLTEEQIAQIQELAIDELPTGKIISKTELFPDYKIVDEEIEPDWPDTPTTTFTHEPNQIIVHDDAGTMVIPLDEAKLEEQLAEAVQAEHHADGYVTVNGQVYHASAAPQPVIKQPAPTYVQNEEQAESNKWLSVTKPVSEAEYLNTLEQKKQADDGK
jgi:hypothetical protein